MEAIESSKLSTIPESMPLTQEEITRSITASHVQSVYSEGNEKMIKQLPILWLKLKKLFIRIIICGSVIALLNFISLTLRFYWITFGINANKFSFYYTQYFVRFFIIGLSMVGFALPLGLPIALFIAIKSSIKKMKSQNILVKNMKACETIGNITTICFDKIGFNFENTEEAIDVCQRAGIVFRLITSDSIESARDFAEKNSIINKSDEHLLVLDAKEFHNRIKGSDGRVNQELFDKVWPNLRVLAQSSSNDKYILVKHMIESKLNTNREVVAVISTEDSDERVLELANVSLTSGTAGDNAAKEASDIILADNNNNFSNIVKAILYGRNAYEIIVKFLQFQLTLNLVTILINSIGYFNYKEVIVKFSEFLWINLLLGSLAALSLSINPPDSSLMHYKPNGRTESLISRSRINNTIWSSIYELICLICVLLFAKDYYFKKHNFVFNLIAIMSVFNVINCRLNTGEKHKFVTLFKNPLFYMILFIALVIHKVFAQFYLSRFLSTDLEVSEWFWCVFVAMSVLMLNIFRRYG